MTNNAHAAYLESTILTAQPTELIRILYNAAIGAVRDARGYLAEANIAARSKAITKAAEIIAELNSSLDFEAGGELSLNLLKLYDYMQRRLLEANIQQSDQALAETLQLLHTLAEAWEATCPGEPPQQAPQSYAYADAESEPVAKTWSL